ncbi:universal stress protein [Pseudonocardia sp. H11422]|nr:universal stress protein [Pseudonocardia sp. H11422]
MRNGRRARTIVAGVDGSDSALEAVCWAARPWRRTTTLTAPF